MKIHVRLAERFWRAVGFRDVELTLHTTARVDALLAALREQFPALVSEFDQTPPHIFIGEAESSRESVLADGAHVHLLWPIAGG